MSFFARLSRRGFVGPRYDGLVGKLRLVWQEMISRREIVLIADSAPLPSLPSAAGLLKLVFYPSWKEFEPRAAAFDAAYYPGYVQRWRGAFDWGETLVLAMRDDDVVAFGWVQTGHSDGLACHYAVLVSGEYRVLRVGVLPQFRRQGINAAFYALLLRNLLARAGATRVYIDCSRDNIPSLRAQLRAGFRPLGELDVRGRLRGNGLIRWRGPVASEFIAELTRIP